MDLACEEYASSATMSVDEDVSCFIWFFMLGECELGSVADIATVAVIATIVGIDPVAGIDPTDTRMAPR